MRELSLKQSFVVSLYLILCACAGSSNTASNSGGGSGELSIGGKSPAAFYEQFSASVSKDCAGFRQTDRLASAGLLSQPDGHGRQNVAQFYLKILGHGMNGAYKAYYREAMSGQNVPDLALKDWTIINGAWNIQGRRMVLKNLGVIDGEVIQNIPRLNLTVDSPMGRYNSDGKFILTMHPVMNLDRLLSSIGNCAPVDNSHISVKRNDYFIDGQRADEAWLRIAHIPLNQGHKEGVATSRDYSEGFQRRTTAISVKINEDGTFGLVYSDSPINVSAFASEKNIVGRWDIQEGLLVLENFGVMIPMPFRDGAKVLIPQLVLYRDPMTLKEMPFQFFPMNLVAQ